MKPFFSAVLFCLLCIGANAQLKKDTLKTHKRSFESSLFSNDDSLTRSDYLLSIGKIFKTLNEASIVSQPVPFINGMNLRIDEDDSAIIIIKDRLTNNERGLNIRNLQMFTILLGEINKNTKKFSRNLNVYDSTLDEAKKHILDIRKDTVLRHLFRDSIVRASFRSELQELRTKWKRTDSLVKYVEVLIDNTLARTSANLIATSELQIQAESLEGTIGPRAFSKERRYLWEPMKIPAGRLKSFSEQFKKTISSEKKITQYYFSHTHNQFMLLLVSGLIFFFWILYNFRSLKKNKGLETIESFHFQYVNRVPIFASLVFMLNLAPLFDLDAPFVYIESIEFFMMIVLTVSFWKRLPRKLFFFWSFFIVLFLLQSFSRYLGLPFYLNRWFSLFINGISFLFGLYALLIFRKQVFRYRILTVVATLYTFLNALAVLCNLFGRVTLMQVFSSTGTYAFIQTVALVVFVGSVTEALLLQIQASRVRRDYKTSFDHDQIAKGVSKMIIFWAVIIWIVVFLTNLNLYNILSEKITKVFITPRVIGNFSFTLGGIILFLVIMWTANFLQKYIAYFFGDVGDDSAFDNKGERSRLMVTRLVLLVAGFLLAVAASGLAIDRITVILGALSVGIGLGLQSIVNNFVSGIILIFDRSLRIGDTVEIGDRKGRVKEISMRSSTLLTPEGAEVIIPNGDILSHNFVNWSLSNNFRRVDLTFNIVQSDITPEIQRSITDIIKSSPFVLPIKEPEVFINTITSQSTDLKVYFWCKDVNRSEQAKSDVYAKVYKELEEKGIKIL
ncbi:MAG: mechanosensitive ion channel domain-containing protein [Ginsengibacter sp.]